MGVIAKGHEETLVRGTVDMSIILIVVMVSWIYKCVETSNCILRAIFICQLYFNKIVFKKKKKNVTRVTPSEVNSGLLAGLSFRGVKISHLLLAGVHLSRVQPPWTPSLATPFLGWLLELLLWIPCKHLGKEDTKLLQ